MEFDISRGAPESHIQSKNVPSNNLIITRRCSIARLATVGTPFLKPRLLSVLLAGGRNPACKSRPNRKEATEIQVLSSVERKEPPTMRRTTGDLES